jgi:putative drug exporter of the RND superfamily
VSVLTLQGLAAALSVSNTAVTLAVMIGLAAGVDYALFIVSRHRAQLAALSVVGIPFLTVMGLSAAGAVLTAVLIATTLPPAIFGVAGSRLAPKPGSRAARLASRTAESIRRPEGPAETHIATRGRLAVTFALRMES